MKIKSTPESDGRRTGVQSVEVGLSVLKVVAEANGPMTLANVASATGMPRSQVHKYLTSFIRAGFVWQTRPGEPYSLGPYALELGLAAMRRLEITQVAQETLNELRDELSTTASLAVWGNRGPTIVQWAETPQLISQTVRLGTVFPVLTSTLGLVFAAHLDRRLTEQIIEAELNIPNGAAARFGLRTWDDVERRLEVVRREGFVAADSVVASGVTAIAAPVMNHAGVIVGVIGVAEQLGLLESPKKDITVRALRAGAGRLSARLGAPARSDGAA
ncbi:IclR family transcriptional regulator [Roseiarcaceae bacterium H3SJ34-1]|uniref:IclR family transcriptional regulator n=1 Tax=Terripilifer ovatus TaxID=3032367 RepID=UPI003AB94061|nr:IclR family transcriptional regulator [Roseiarcaceae bacterium H3SJ34-1]